MLKTRTFVENRWWRVTEGGQFAEVPATEVQETDAAEPIDDQVNRWLEDTGAVIVHPGQLGMHTSWHGDKTNPYQLKCVTFGLVVLYQEA